MTDPFDPDALFDKAKLFINRCFDAHSAGQFDAAALWASLALEIVAKWALATVNPCLIADPSDDGTSLLTAAGLSKTVADFKTIPAKAAFSRCARAFPGFNAREAGRISGNRNDDIHSGALPFAQLDEERWWQSYWREVAVLLSAHGMTVSDLVGAENAGVAEGYITRNNETVSFLVAKRIEAAKARWESRESGVERLGGFVFGPEYESSAVCPACGNRGELMGDSVVGEQEVWPDSLEDYFTPFSLLDVASHLFNCPFCNLFLDGPDYISAADLPETFETEVAIEPAWEEYNNE